MRFQNQEKFANIWLVLTIQTDMPVGFTIVPLVSLCSTCQREKV